jgi:3-oxoadipate enol-lactonase/4-carboxymuconolactone decarboxylase
VPVLCLAGQHDTTAPPAVSQRMAAAIPDGRFAELPGLGHLAPIESPRAVLDAVRPWLAAIAHAD